MLVDGEHYRTIWLKKDGSSAVQIIDQRLLPHEFVVEDLRTVDDVCVAIKDMHVRGAGLIGATAGYGMYIAALHARNDDFFNDMFDAAKKLKSTRPTAVNLAWAVDRQLAAVPSGSCSLDEKVLRAWMTAKTIADEDANCCRRIGLYGEKLIELIYRKKKSPVNILTHCNAGWLAFVDYGSATAPIYKAHEFGIPLHVWVDETRPWNQGSRLTAWELGQQGVRHTIISDNAGGHLMQHGMVDLVITGADRVTRTGDAANKIGTYLKALAAKDNKVPFYVALPSSTFDWNMRDGVKDIPIEQRDSEEVLYATGKHEGSIKRVLLAPEGSNAANYGFDVTPRSLITGLITERGVCKPNERSICQMFGMFS